MIEVILLGCLLADGPLEKLDALVDGLAARQQGTGAPKVAGLLAREFATREEVPDPYVVSTFSFEFGTRDDVQLVRNDWDLAFGNGENTFDVRMVVDDRSRIFDLGAVDLGTAPLPDAAVKPDDGKPVEAVKGHVYLVHTVDFDTDLWTRFRVLEIEPMKWVTFEWQSLDSTPALRRLERLSLPDVGTADISLEVTSAEGGGNPYGVFFDATATIGVDNVTRDGQVALEKSRRPDSVAITSGAGLIPEGKVFLVESISWTAELASDAAGPLDFEFWVGPYRVAKRESRDGENRRHTIDGGAREEDGRSSMGKFAGPVVLRPGDETRVAAIASRGTIARATITGRLVDARSTGLPPRSIDLSKRDAIEANDALRRIDEGAFEDVVSAPRRVVPESVARVTAFLEDVLRFRTAREDRERIESVLAEFRSRKNP